MKRLPLTSICRSLGSRLRLAWVLALILTTVSAPVKLPAEFWEMISSESHEETRAETKGEDLEGLVRSTTKTSRRFRRTECVTHLAQLLESDRLPPTGFAAPPCLPAHSTLLPFPILGAGDNLRC